LQYPNPFTFYFTNLIIVVFGDVFDDNLHEQITKNLIRRLIIEKPHPWGILSLLYKILTNDSFKFDKKNFYIQNEVFVDKLVKLAFKYAKISENPEL
jgi:hypothetical protein